MGITDALKAGGFKPEANEDQDYPPITGEYKAVVTELAIWEKNDQKAYRLNLQLAQTLSGKVSDGRFLSKFYNVGGTKKDGTSITQEEIDKNLKKLLNDLFTMGIELDLSSDEAMENSFGKAKDSTCFVRAWYKEPYQNFVIKQEKDLKKESKGEPATAF